MEAAWRRLLQGDASSLPDIIDCIEAGLAPPTGRGPAKVYNVLTTMLLQEGQALREAPVPNPLGPTPDAFNAMRVLAILGVRIREEGHHVKSALLALGLQRCREMSLDSYFVLSRWQRYYVVMFVFLVTRVYGCRPHDLLRNPTSLNLLMGSTEADRGSPFPAPTIEATEFIPALPHHTTHATAPATSGGANGAATSSPVNPQPPTTGASTSPPRRRNIQNRSAALVSIPGTSTDLPLQPARWYRELPRKAINAPFPVNPLYVKMPLHGRGNGSPPPAEHVAEDAASRNTPGAPSLAPEIPMTAQFPTPVVLFTAYHGVGCVPRLPTTEDLARLETWRERQQAHAEVRSPRGTPSPSQSQPTPLNVWGSMLELASQLRGPAASSGTAVAAGEGGQPAFLIHNEMTFSAANTGAAAYHRRCLDSPLLRQYLEQGALLSWGSSAKGALGPRRQRHTRHALEPARGTTGTGDHGAGKASPQSGAQAVRGGEKSPITAALVPAAAAPEAPLLSHVSVSTGGALMPAPSLATALPTGAADDSGSSAFVYLPLPVHTSMRVAQVACGLAVTYALTVDGTLYCCGRAESGQLGIGERSVRYAEAGATKLQRVLLRDSDRVTRIAAGTACAAAVSSDNALYCWGHNVYGQCLKMPDASRVLTPVRLRSGMFKVLDICYGQFFGVLLFDDGVLGTWGITSMLGCKMSDKSLENSLAPDQCKCARQVVHLRLTPPTPMAAVRAGPWHALAISRKGEVFTWGVGRNGRLGHGTDTSEVRPRLVEGLRSCFAVDASCSNAHSAVLTSTGAVYVFGENAEGQLGLRGLAPRRLPTMVALPGKAVAVACAREHTCILLADGDVVACGSYRTCGVGLGYGRRLCAPVRVLTNYVTLTLHSSHLHGMAGVVHRRTAVMVVGHSTIDEVSRVSSLVVRNGVRCAASGAGFLVVLSENNSLVAIGRGERGQLGIGDCMRPARKEDVTVAATFGEVCLPPDVAIQHVRCGPDFAVALDAEGIVYGWGSNEYHKLCQPATVPHVFAPIRLTAYGEHRVVQVACGASFVVALTADGKVLTHGEAVYCGIGTPPPSGPRTVAAVAVPTPVPGLRDVVAVAAGRRHALAMTASCGVFAWGVGVLGNASAAAAPAADCFTAVTPLPVRVALSQTIRCIGCGPHNSFAISDEGELWVWGMNRYGECGVPANGGTTSTAAGTGATGAATAGAAVAANGTRRDGEAAPDRATAITTPTSVARDVRDAAFTTQFGVVVFEDGQVRVSGRIRHGGQRYLLPSFHSTPQPVFSVNVNEPAPRAAPQSAAAAATAAAAAPRGSGAGGEDSGNGNTKSATAAASAPRSTLPQTVTEVGAALPDEEEEGTSTASTASSSSTSLHAAAATMSAALPTDGQHTRHPEPPSPTRMSGHGSDLGTLPRVDQRPAPVRRASPRGGHLAPWSRHGSSYLPSSRSITVAGGRTSHASAGSEAAAPFDYGQDSLPNYSLPSLLGLLPSAPESMRQSTTAATAGTRSREGGRSELGWDLYAADDGAAASLTGAEANLYNEYSTSPAAAQPTNSVAPSEADAYTPMPPHRVSDHGAAPAVRSRTVAAVQGRMASSATWGTAASRESPLPAAPVPPRTPGPERSSVHSAGAGRVAARAAAEHAGRELTPPPPAGRRGGSPSALSLPPQGTERPPKTRSPRQDAVPAPQSVPQPQPLVPPSAASGEHIFGLRCFAGWEQICVVMEKHRPTKGEVGMAQAGLKVLVRQPEDSTRDM